MDLLWFFLGMLGLPMAALGLGRFISKDQGHWEGHLALGWVVLSFLAAGLAQVGILQDQGCRWISLVLALFGLWKWVGFLKKDSFKAIKLNSFPKALLVLSLVLVGIRLLKVLLPPVGWDALNYHLPMATAYLEQGSLMPLWDWPTDRRVPLGGVLMKSWSMAFDTSGRLLIWNSLLFYIAICSLVLKISRKIFSDLNELYLLPIFILLASTDYAIYSLGVGDEVFLALLFLTVVLAFFEDQNQNRRWGMMLWILLGFTCAIKLTSLLFIFPIFFVLLWKQKKSGTNLIVGLFVFILVSCCWHVRSWKSYDMIYPFTRWSNLLYEGGEGSKRLPVEEVRKERVLLVGERDRNDIPLLSSIGQRLKNNLFYLITMPLGPLWLWGVPCLLILWFRKIKMPKEIKKIYIISILCLIPALVAWHFSSAALFRYLLPVWPLLILALNWPVLKAINLFEFKQQFNVALGLLLLLAIGLEGKQNLKRIDASVLNPKAFWLANAADGQLLLEDLPKVREEAQRVFYLGPSSYLCEKQDLVAQVGNEVGWRRLNEFHSYLIRKQVSLLVVSRACDYLDNAAYSAHVQWMKKMGQIKLVKETTQGWIYQVQLIMD